MRQLDPTVIEHGGIMDLEGAVDTLIHEVGGIEQCGLIEAALKNSGISCDADREEIRERSEALWAAATALRRVYLKATVRGLGGTWATCEMGREILGDSVEGG
jgi:hypothetical protein